MPIFKSNSHMVQQLLLSCQRLTYPCRKFHLLPYVNNAFHANNNPICNNSQKKTKEKQRKTSRCKMYIFLANIIHFNSRKFSRNCNFNTLHSICDHSYNHHSRLTLCAGASVQWSMSMVTATVCTDAYQRTLCFYDTWKIPNSTFASTHLDIFAWTFTLMHIWLYTPDAEFS